MISPKPELNEMTAKMSPDRKPNREYMIIKPNMPVPTVIAAHVM